MGVMGGPKGRFDTALVSAILAGGLRRGRFGWRLGDDQVEKTESKGLDCQRLRSSTADGVGRAPVEVVRRRRGGDRRDQGLEQRYWADMAAHVLEEDHGSARPGHPDALAYSRFRVRDGAQAKVEGDRVEGVVAKLQVLGIHLMEAYLKAQGVGAKAGSRQHPWTQVHAVDADVVGVVLKADAGANTDVQDSPPDSLTDGAAGGAKDPLAQPHPAVVRARAPVERAFDLLQPGVRLAAHGLEVRLRSRLSSAAGVVHPVAPRPL